MSNKSNKADKANAVNHKSVSSVSEDKYNIKWDNNHQNASSTTEMTGLIPSAARTMEEIESYNDLMTFRSNEKIAGEKKLSKGGLDKDNMNKGER